ncbi:MAG TPA: CHASE2 domain-containing protein [Syntrophales bacterium]|nr:CHASE2 domain-containing protein [Syntrophales bacterium]
MKRKLIGPAVSDIIIGAVLTVLTIAAVYFEWMPTRYLEYKLYDAISNLKERTFKSPIVIVAIDDESIANMGRWPWPRSYIARMVDFLNRCEARVIGINILYSEKDTNQGLTEVRDILKNIQNDTRLLHNVQVNSIYTSLKETENRLDNDAILGTSIGESKKVILPLVFIMGNSNVGKESEVPDYLKRNSVPVATHEGSMAARQIVPPIPDFAMKAMALGHVNVVPDGDGTVRSEPLVVSYEGRVYPSYGLQLSLKYLNYDMKDLSITKGVNFGDNYIATSDKGEMLISFSKSVPYFSFYDVVSNKAPPEVFKDKIVIIAESAIRLGSLQVTPIGPDVPSWGIIANVADNILAGDYIVRPAWAPSLEIGVIVLLGLFLTLIVPRLKIRISAIASLILLLVWIGAGTCILINYGYWIKLVHPSLLILIGYILVVTHRHFSYGRDKGAHRNKRISFLRMA